MTEFHNVWPPEQGPEDTEHFSGLRGSLVDARVRLLGMYADEGTDFEDIQAQMAVIDGISVDIGRYKAFYNLEIYNPEREAEATQIVLDQIADAGIELHPLEAEAILIEEYKRSRTIQTQVEAEMAGVVNFQASWLLRQASEALQSYQTSHALRGFHRESIELVAEMVRLAEGSEEMPNMHLVENHLAWDPYLETYKTWLQQEIERLRQPGQRWRGAVPKRDLGVPNGWGEIPIRDERHLSRRLWSRIVRRNPWEGLYNLVIEGR